MVMELLGELDPEDKVINFRGYRKTVSALLQPCETAGLGCITLAGTGSLTKRQKASR